MSEDEIFSLIDVMIERKDEYNRPHVEVIFWRKVASDLQTLCNLSFSGEACSKEWKELVATYKDYTQRPAATGTGVQEDWPFYEALQPILADNVTVQALKTISERATPLLIKKNPHIEDNEVPASAARGVKSRPPAKPRKTSNPTLNALQNIQQGREQLLGCFQELLAVLQKKPRGKEEEEDDDDGSTA